MRSHLSTGLNNAKKNATKRAPEKTHARNKSQVSGAVELCPSSTSSNASGKKHQSFAQTLSSLLASSNGNQRRKSVVGSLLQKPEQMLSTFTAAQGMHASVQNTYTSLDSASKVISSRLRTLDNILEWADELAQAIPQVTPIPKASAQAFVAGVFGTGIPSTSLASHRGHTGVATFHQGPEWPVRAPPLTSSITEDNQITVATIKSTEEATAFTVHKPSSTQGTPTNQNHAIDYMEPCLKAALDGEETTGAEILHPGVHGSSSVSIDRFEEHHAAMVTVRAAVRVQPCVSSDDNSCVPMHESDPGLDVAVAFAASAAAQAAFACSKELLDFASPVIEGKTTSRHHQAILETLQNGAIVNVEEQIWSQFSHESFIVEVQHPSTSFKCKALVKPRENGDFDGWHRTPIERVAYVLNLLLGQDYVPPTVYRQNLEVNGQVYPHGGALIYFVDGMKLLEEVPQERWGMDKEVLLSDTRVLDVLLHNADRHIGHFAWGPHWAYSGSVPILIDHAAGFRDGACVCMEQDNAFNTGRVKHISSRTYLRLKLLDTAVIAKRMHGILSPGEIVELVQRRDGVLKYLDELIRTEGIENVLLA